MMLFYMHGLCSIRKLVKTDEKTVMAYLMVMSWNLHEKNEKIIKLFSQDNM